MHQYFEYTLKAACCLAITFIFYSLLLKKITWYKWNRYFLVFFSLLSFVVPLISVNVLVQGTQANSISFINQLPVINASPLMRIAPGRDSSFYYKLAAVVFIPGSSILLLRLIIQLLSIKRMKSRATLLLEGEVNLYHVAAPVLPFSFLNDIFLNKDQYSESEFREILHHESIHAKHKHSIDVLVTEIICILNWYNPFAWLIKTAVRENLEFIADDAVIRNGADKKDYQYLLLKVTGDIPSGISSNLKFSPLKNRILMMNKSRTNRTHLLKFIVLAPLLMLVLFAFRNKKEVIKEVVNNTETFNEVNEAYTLSTLTYSIPDAKVKAIVIKEQESSLLKAGQLLDLSLVYNEKNRLKKLLEINGYTNLKSNAILFMIDTASVRNSFSVEIKINVDAPVPFTRKKALPQVKGEITSPDIRLVPPPKVEVKPPVNSLNNYNRMLNNILHPEGC